MQAAPGGSEEKEEVEPDARKEGNSESEGIATMMLAVGWLESLAIVILIALWIGLVFLVVGDIDQWMNMGSRRDHGKKER